MIVYTYFFSQIMSGEQIKLRREFKNLIEKQLLKPTSKAFGFMDATVSASHESFFISLGIAALLWRR